MSRPLTVKTILKVDQLDQLWYNRPSSTKGEPMIVNVSEAKTNLSKLIDMVYHGERVVIAKNNTPLVDMVPHQPTGKRELGLLQGKFTVPDNFNDEDDGINAMFYGSSE